MAVIELMVVMVVAAAAVQVTAEQNLAVQVIKVVTAALGHICLVVVAAEMIAVNSGLGFLIVDARNAGNRYDLVVAGMVAAEMMAQPMEKISPWRV